MRRSSGHNLGFVMLLPVAILDFQSRGFRSGSHVTGNPRWRREVSNIGFITVHGFNEGHIAPGDRKWHHKSKMAAWTGSPSTSILTSECPCLTTHSSPLQRWLISSAPGRFQWNFRYVIFNLILVIGGWGISYEIALRWYTIIPHDDKLTLVQVIAWCHQAPSHYLSQCWCTSSSS